jgi:hypothetical protein
MNPHATHTPSPRPAAAPASTNASEPWQHSPHWSNRAGKSPTPQSPAQPVSPHGSYADCPGAH